MFVSFALFYEGGGVGVEAEGRDELPPGVGVGDRWLGGDTPRSASWRLILAARMAVNSEFWANWASA